MDFIFYPKDKMADGIILELKADHTPQEAVRQIKDRRYDLRLRGRLAEQTETPFLERILLVGIAFDRKSKKHSCVVEELNF